MVHTRETRASASEIKFLIDASRTPRIREWARSHLEPDPHGGGAFGDEYELSTLYFDTTGLDVLRRRDSFGRAKYRIRRYGDADVVFLERKLRRPGVLIKRRTAVPVTALAVAAGRGEAPQDGVEWFRRRIDVRRLRPVCQIQYSRMARIAGTDEGTVRLTLDTTLRATAIGGPAFSSAPSSAFLAGRHILELKYTGALPAVFRRLVEEFALAPQPASKYRLGMAALGHPLSADRTQAAAGASYA